jgi:hypothetical protein
MAAAQNVLNGALSHASGRLGPAALPSDFSLGLVTKRIMLEAL